MWLCSQIGAREHYSVPRVLHRDGRLAALYTDFWATNFLRKAARKTNVNSLHSLAARFHPELEKARVISWNARSLAWEAGSRQKKFQVYENFIKIGTSFARRVREALRRRNDLNPHSIFFSYDTGALETLEWCREKNIKCILNQMDPNRVEVQTVQEEEKRWPDWNSHPLHVPEEYFKRRESEWTLADKVIVNSDFSKQALARQGVPHEKLVVVPLSFETEHANQETGSRQKPNTPLRVLFLGQVILRKGIQYLVQAAKLLEREPVTFDVVGPVGISTGAVASAPPNVTFHGRITRNQAARWYHQSDVFVLPTLSDGFAITQLEAMSFGLPVVATPCCGNVVSDSSDGFIVPPRDAHALANALQKYLIEPGLLEHQRDAAMAKVKQFSLNHLAANLRSLEQSFNL